MAIRQIQSVFTLGELSKRLFARTDFPGYFKGAQTLRDVLTLPLGGVKRRFGTKYIKTIVDTGDSDEPITDSDEVKAFQYIYSGAKTFLILARPNDRTGTPGVSFEIYLDDTLQTTVTSTDYTIAQISSLYFVASQERVVILHPDVQPHQLIRASDASWSISAITFNYVPTYDFSLIDSNSYRGSTVTFTPSADSGTGVTLTAANYTYDAGHVGGIFTGNGGVFRITSVNAGGTVATGDVVETFGGTTAIKGANATLESAAWGDFTGGTPSGIDRGWPSVGTFFQERLILANTPSLPRMIFFSNQLDYFNFDDSEPLDTNGFSYPATDDVVDVVGNKALLVFTNSTVEASSVFVESPITAGNVFINVQSFQGASTVPATVLDNQAMFVDKNTQQINAMNYDINSGSFNVLNINVLSPQVIDNPSTIAAYRPSSNDGEILLAPNADGTMGLLQSLISEEVQGWTLARTTGDFKQAYAAGDSANIITRRSISTGSTVTGTVDNVFTTNDELEGIIDISTAAQSSSTDSAIFTNDGDFLVLGHEAPFSRIAVVLDTAASATIEPVFQYLNASGVWTTFTPDNDNTSGFTTNGEINWGLSDETSTWKAQLFPKNVTEGIISSPFKKFWLRIQRTADSLGTTPIEESIKVNVGNRLHLESINFSYYTDATEDTSSDSSGVVTGLDHLIGLQVYARVDGIPEGPFFVDSSGEITLEKESSDVQVGLNYTPEIVPMPLVSPFEFMQSVYQPKHVKSIYIDYVDSLGVLVNGLEVPSLSLNQLILDQTPMPQTSFYEITPMRGWDSRSTNTISQELPLPMTIIGIGYRLEAT